MDPISNMIVAIKNAGDAGLDTLTMPYSKTKEAIARVLKNEGFLKEVEVDARRDKKMLVFSLFLEDRNPKIRGVKRISKTSKRVYKKSSEIRPVKNGYGLLVLTTPEGVMSGRDAKRLGVGGEALFTIW